MCSGWQATRPSPTTTLNIPHPRRRAAESWITTHQERWQSGLGVICAITLRSTGEVVGAISVLGISQQNSHGEMGYWIGKPYWGNGYCAEGRSCADPFQLRDDGSAPRLRPSPGAQSRSGRDGQSRHALRRHPANTPVRPTSLRIFPLWHFRPANWRTEGSRGDVYHKLNQLLAAGHWYVPQPSSTCGSVP